MASPNHNPKLPILSISYPSRFPRLTIGAFRINGALALTFTVLLLTFIALTYGFLVNPVPWKRIGGWLGILTAALAWYIMLAGILRSVSGGAIQLPLFPIKK